MASVTNKFKFDKKSNVIHLTTSETMRMGESELLESCVRIIPSPSGSTNLRSNQSILLSRKKTPSSFQITEVCLTRTDIGDDSADDLDESHTDDNSRVTDNETPSFSEDSRDTEDHHGSTIAYAQSPIAVTTTTGPSSVVSTCKSTEEKFEPSAVKIRNHRVKGRWTCLDYVDPQQIPVSLSIPNHETFVNQYLKSSSALKDCELFLEKEFYDVLLPDKNGVSLNMIKIDDAYRRVASILTTTTSGKLISTSESCTVAIDSKIEQAMDLVKSHLMYAVRQDVNILKLKISELLVRISQLEAENLYLRANASPEVLKLLDRRSKQQI